MPEVLFPILTNNLVFYCYITKLLVKYLQPNCATPVNFSTQLHNKSFSDLSQIYNWSSSMKIESTSQCLLLPSPSLILAVASHPVQQRPSSTAPPSLGIVLALCYCGSNFYKVLFSHICNAGVKMRTEPVTDTTRNNHRKIRSRT